jgi:hypothetical protein
MYSNILFLVVMALAGITLMYYTNVFCRKMQFMGDGFPHRIVEKMLGDEGGEPTPTEVEEALDGLRRRLLLACLLLLALTLALLASAFLLAWQFTTSSLPLILVGLAVLAFSASLSAVILRRNLGRET